MKEPLTLFYEEPESDRWLPFDRYPRRIVRRMLRGKRSPGGPERVFLNLRAGLDSLGREYRVNDYRYAGRHPSEIACIIGKPHLLDRQKWRNPIVFGAATFSHPVEKPNFFDRYPTVRKTLVPGEWMRKMWQPYFGDRVVACPVGIDTDLWSPSINEARGVDVLLYDKVRWKHDEYERTLLDPIRKELEHRGLHFREIRYSYYREEEFHKLLSEARAMIFLCEHETQGIAYQQALSAGVPILAWDRSGYWRDPAFFPDRVKFAPVSSVPYWDERCGLKFGDVSEFGFKLDEFLDRLNGKRFNPRDYILENLTLEKCAKRYLEIYDGVKAEL